MNCSCAVPGVDSHDDGALRPIDNLKFSWSYQPCLGVGKRSGQTSFERYRASRAVAKRNQCQCGLQQTRTSRLVSDSRNVGLGVIDRLSL